MFAKDTTAEETFQLWKSGGGHGRGSGKGGADWVALSGRIYIYIYIYIDEHSGRNLSHDENRNQTILAFFGTG